MLHDQSSEPTLVGRHLRRSFGTGEAETIALNDVSLDLHPCQINLLMGPSGSGKSTLLAALSGLLHPNGGKVLALGQDMWALSEKQREYFRLKHCGFIFQGYNLFGALNARQQLEMVVQWGEGASARVARKRAEQMLSLLGLGNKMHLRPCEMSGGEKQRVAIGRALIKEPNFCFADEPTSALDWAHGEQVVELLCNAAHERNSTILIVAHDARIIPYVDRVFHIEDGVLRESEDAASDPDLQRHYGKNGAPAAPYPSVPH